jgi:hypothetical protein
MMANRRKNWDVIAQVRISVCNNRIKMMGKKNEEVFLYFLRMIHFHSRVPLCPEGSDGDPSER